MKRHIYLFWIVIIALLVTTSCNIETSGNGKLDGYWHLITVDTLKTGGVSDLSNYKFFWSVQANLLEVTDKIGGNDLIFTFTHIGDTISLSNPYIAVHDGEDIPTTNIALLKPFGINSLSEKFVIESLTGGNMTLRGDSLRLNFRKQ